MTDPVTVQPTRAQLRALADAATPGPWEVHGSLIGIGRAKPDFGQTWGLRWRQDIEFICAARTAVPQLLDQLDQAEADRDWLLRSSRLAKEERIKANARADQAEAELDSWMARAYEAEKRAWQAEKRITRLEAQTDIRGRAVVMYRERAREAEAQIEAVRDLCDDADKRHASVLIVTKVRRALDN